MSPLKSGQVVDAFGLVFDGVDDFLSAMAGVDTPHPRRAVEDFSILVVRVMHAAGRY